jgi:hypothetical protein
MSEFSNAVAAAALGAAIVMTAGCSRVDPGPYENAEQAVRAHIGAARRGDVAVLRRDACGPLAAAMSRHSDAAVQQEFLHAYDGGPDDVRTTSAHPDDAVGRQTVVGYYTHVRDLQITFLTEDHRGWQVCEIQRRNSVFGRLPDPFEQT